MFGFENIWRFLLLVLEEAVVLGGREEVTGGEKVGGRVIEEGWSVCCKAFG